MLIPDSLDWRLLRAPERPPLLTQLMEGLAIEELDAAAEGPLAPLVCRSLARDVTESGPVAERLATAVLTGLSRQDSMLAVLDASDELLTVPAIVRTYGRRLVESFLAGHAAALVSHPMIAATFAEGAVRLAVAGAGSPFGALAVLTPAAVGELDPDYAERLPRLIGVALDLWGLDPAIADPLRAALTTLQDLPDAAFEQGMDLVRQAMSGQREDCAAGLRLARDRFAMAEGLQASLYENGSNAVVAFLDGDGASLHAAREGLATQLGRRAVDLRNSHVPEWCRPRAEAAYGWARLIATLEQADRLGDGAAVAALFDVYALDRSVIPVAGVLDRQGLPRLVRPVIGTATIERHTPGRTALREPAATRTLAQLSTEFDEDPGYAGETRIACDVLVAEIVSYLVTAPAGPPSFADLAGWLRRGRLGSGVTVHLGETGLSVRFPVATFAVVPAERSLAVRLASGAQAGPSSQIVVPAPRIEPVLTPDHTPVLVYAVAVAIAESPGRRNPERQLLRREMHRVLENAFRDGGLDWAAVRREDHGEGTVVMLPASTAGVHLGGTFAGALERCLRECAQRYQHPHRLRLRVAVALGLADFDEYGVSGEPIEAANRLAAHAGTRARLSGSDDNLLAFAVSDDFYRAVIRQGYRQIDRDAFLPLPGADPTEPAWILTPDRPAGAG
ncbi:hypothetical protein [Actinoplanes sp. TFC3]|uniref:hypothetical protein n=1 Tax=Actinoplanes sp. TFC3 TaxID=1710355 RepID=UPI00082FFC35|nr:hypothetical protein [Actinoplanes sp. TFC3]